MANHMVFHTQIASIMEELANTAVADICKLVDDDYAVFRLEITQSRKENRTLRRKLQLLELKVARERAERTMRERVLGSRPRSVKILDRYRGMARGTFCPVPLCACVWIVYNNSSGVITWMSCKKLSVSLYPCQF